MVYQGIIQDGKLILENGVQLPEGAPVRVELLTERATDESHTAGYDVLLNMSDFAVDMGIPDLAVNINHYLYGHPKVTDGP
jgi:hypothetical protein